MRTLPAQLLAALRAVVVLSVLLGITYPPGRPRRRAAGFPQQGERLDAEGGRSGRRSDLIVESFTDPAAGEALPQFCQPSASNAGAGCDPTRTTASNLGPDVNFTIPDGDALEFFARS